MSSIDHLLTSKDPALRVYGRLMASEIRIHATNWIIAERDRGTNPADIISAILILASGLSSGILTLTSTGSADIQKSLTECFEALLKADVARIQEALK